MLEKRLVPVQLVINWDERGALANAHLVRNANFYEEGVLIGTAPQPTVPLSISDFDGDNLKLAEIADALKESGIIEVASYKQTIAELRAVVAAGERDARELTEQLEHANAANANAAQEITNLQDQLRMLGESNRRMAVDVDVARHELDVANARTASTRALLVEAQENYARLSEKVNGNA